MNPAIFRQANEKIVRAVDGFGGPAEQLVIMCECALAECREMLTVSHGHYDDVRNDQRLRVVLPGHVVECDERVVRHYPGCWAVAEERSAVAWL